MLFDSSDYWASPVFTRAISNADTFSFYLDVFLCIALAVFYTGWHWVMNVRLELPAIASILLAIAIRYIELKHPAAYRRWRWPLFRFARVFKSSFMYSHGWQIRTLYRSASLSDDVLEAAFMYHRIKTHPYVNAARALMLSSGSAAMLATIVRYLPFAEQLLLCVGGVLLAGVCLAPPALLVLSRPMFKNDMYGLCEALTNAANVSSLLFSPLPDPSPTSAACEGQRGLARLIMFTQFYMILVVPMYCCFQYEYRLTTECLRHALVTTYGSDLPADAPSTGSWLQRMLVDTVALICLALLTWQCLLVYDLEVTALFDQLQVVVDTVAARITSTLGRS